MWPDPQVFFFFPLISFHKQLLFRCAIIFVSGSVDQKWYNVIREIKMSYQEKFSSACCRCDLIIPENFQQQEVGRDKQKPKSMDCPFNQFQVLINFKESRNLASYILYTHLLQKLANMKIYKDKSYDFWR